MNKRAKISGLKRTFFLLLILIISIPLVHSQTIKGEKLKEELFMLRDLAIGLSPKLSKTDKQKIRHIYNQKAKELDDKNLTIIDFLKFLDTIEVDHQFDEHANTEIPESVLLPRIKSSKFFPISLKFIGNNMVVNSEDFSIPYGSIITAINNKSIEQILEDLLGEKRELNSFQKKQMEKSFYLLYSLLGDGFKKETFEVTYKESLTSSKTLKKTIAGYDFNTLKAKYNSVYPLHKKQLGNQINTYFNKANKTYYFQLNSFNWIKDPTANSYSKLKREFKEVFNDIKNKQAENLIIDLRFNGGGDVEVPGLLYSFIARERFNESIKFTIPDMEIPLTERIVLLDGKKVTKVKEIKRYIKRMKSEFDKLGDEYVLSIANNKIIKPNSNAFKGKVFLLVGGDSFSASTYFSALFKLKNRGTIVGEQVGGSHHEMTAGQHITYELPYSKIRVRIPLMVAYFSDEIHTKVSEKKITPDVQLSEEEMYTYFLKKKDFEIEKVKELVHK